MCSFLSSKFIEVCTDNRFPRHAQCRSAQNTLEGAAAILSSSELRPVALLRSFSPLRPTTFALFHFSFAVTIGQEKPYAQPQSELKAGQDRPEQPVCQGRCLSAASDCFGGRECLFRACSATGAWRTSDGSFRSCESAVKVLSRGL